MGPFCFPARIGGGGSAVRRFGGGGLAANCLRNSEDSTSCRRLVDLPEEWPMIVNTYVNTTAVYGYSQLETLMRLQKTFCGEARRTIQCLLIHPQHVNAAMTFSWSAWIVARSSSLAVVTK